MNLPIDEIRKVLRKGRVAADADRLERGRDLWPQALGWDSGLLAEHAPSAVVLPGDEEEAAEVMSWSSRHAIALVPRGAGSSVVGAAVPSPGGSVVLDASLLNKKFFLEEDGDPPRLRAGAGWLGGELEAKLNGLGWSLMHFPASMEISSVGGWIALAGYGQLSTRYGGIDSQLLSVRAAGPDGNFRKDDPAVHIGAEGTLGLVSEATLKIRPLPSRRRFAAYAFNELPEALAYAREAAATAIPPSVMRIYSPVDALLTGLRKSRAPKGSGGSSWLRSVETLLLRGHRLLNVLAPLAGKAWRMILVYEEENGETGSPPPLPSGTRDLGPLPAEIWWQKRYHWSRERLKTVFERGCFGDTADLWAPWDRLAEMDREVRKALAPYAFAFSHCSHFDWRGACLYVTFAGSGGPERHARAWREAMEASLRAGGTVNHHHGFGLAKLPWLEKSFGPERLAALRRKKAERDPKGLLNPGKLTVSPCP